MTRGLCLFETASSVDSRRQIKVVQLSSSMWYRARHTLPTGLMPFFSLAGALLALSVNLAGSAAGFATAASEHTRDKSTSTARLDGRLFDKRKFLLADDPFDDYTTSLAKQAALQEALAFVLNKALVAIQGCLQSDCIASSGRARQICCAGSCTTR